MLFINYQVGTVPALAAENHGREEEDEGGGHHQQDSEHGEDADHLSPVQDDGAPGVAQLPPAGAGVVVTEQEVSLVDTSLFHCLHYINIKCFLEKWPAETFGIVCMYVCKGCTPKKGDLCLRLILGSSKALNEKVEEV